jgi:hypothetical protein
MKMMRLAVLAVLTAIASPGCLVLALDRFYDEPSIIFDERLLGTWVAADDNVTVTVARSDWRAYRVQYVHPTETRVLTAYLFRVRETLYLDLSPPRGEDAGLFLLPAHTLLRATIGARELSVAPLDFDWFSGALTKQTLPADLHATRGERNQVVLGADRAGLMRWLAARGETDPAFGEPVVFRKTTS